jgi:two-component system, OmpR family, alkaline phosphatase synthesis response regulator PhoP
MSAKRVLVADDESHILNVVSLKLRNAGFEVETAEDGTEALERALANRPDLLITDFHMPGLNGLEVCQKLRESETARGIPTIMLSARGYHLTQGELQESGISQMVSKPFSPRQLLAAVNEVLGLAA